MTTKIGIGIVHCQSSGSTNIGYTVVFKSDNGKWSSIIDDTGSVFRYVEIKDETAILKMIHITENGWYMCSMKPIPGRLEEYRASWVYFPSSLELSHRDIKDIIEVAESQIKEKEYDENILLETIQKYQKSNEKGKLLYKIPQTQSGYAFYDIDRGDDHINLCDLYGCIYQKEFFKYKWVLLKGKNSPTPKKDVVQEIPEKESVDFYVSIKPDTNDLLGFTPYLNGEKFCSPVQIMDGEPLSIEFRKDGYMPLKKEIRSQNDFSISKNECKRYFNKRQFVAYDGKTGKRIQISTTDSIRPLNASEDKTKSKWIFLEKDLENAEFYVKVEGYRPDRFTCDLQNKSLNDEIPMNLKPESHEYVFVLPLDRSVVKDRETVDIRIRSQYVIKESPLKHYKCKGTPREGGFPNQLYAVVQSTNDYYLTNNVKNNPEYNGNNVKVTKTQGPKPTCESTKSPDSNDDPEEKHAPLNLVKKHITAFLSILGIIVAGLIFYTVYCKPFNEDAKPEQPPPVTSPDEGTVTSSDSCWSMAYEYLKNNTTEIYKDSMDNYQELKGLYNLLNEYRFKYFKEYIDTNIHKNKILEIDVWKELYKTAQEINENKSGRYNQPGAEQSITFEKYFSRITTNFLTKSDGTPDTPDTVEALTQPDDNNQDNYR